MKNIIIAIVAGAALSACGSFKKAEKNVREETETRKDLAGKWVSDCRSSSLIEGHHAIEQYEFTPTNTYKYRTDIYNDAGCTAFETTYQDEGSYSLPGEAREGSAPIDLKVTDVTVTPRSDTIANQYNSQKYCGFTDWQAGYGKSTMGKDCEGFPIKDQATLHNIVDVRDNKLYLGEVELFLTPTDASQRPNSVNLDVPFTKK